MAKKSRGSTNITTATITYLRHHYQHHFYYKSLTTTPLQQQQLTSIYIHNVVDVAQQQCIQGQKFFKQKAKCGPPKSTKNKNFKFIPL